eukprot:450895_1
MTFHGAVQINRCKKLWDSRNDPEFHDVTFVVGEEQKEFNASKIIIASCSEVIKNTLYWCDEKSDSEQTVTLRQDDPAAFEAMLKFAYCNDPKLNLCNVIKVRKISEKYQIESLSKLCDKYVSDNINASNFCKLFDEAVKSKMGACIDKIQDFMKQRLYNDTQSIINSQYFDLMSLESTKLFLQWDCLIIGEEQLWDAVLKWVSYKQLWDIDAVLMVKSEKLKWRKLLLKKICPFMRFGLMSAQYFVKKVKMENCLTTKEVADILCHIADKNQNCGKFTTKHRLRGNKNGYCKRCGTCA